MTEQTPTPTTARARKERRNLVPPDLTALLVQAKRDYERAKDRYEAAAVVLGCHTLWIKSSGDEVCDHDGQQWPCSTLHGFAFMYDYPLRENWERPK